MKGTTVQIVVRTEGTPDPFGMPTTTEQLVDVPDVLVGQPTTDDITETMALYGKKVEYTLGIPKGDTHKWVDAEVVIWGQRFRTIGFPVTGEPENIPLRWGQNVKVERYG